MKGSYVKGVAIRGGPEPCVGVREGAAKRWIGVYAGRSLSLENILVWGADALLVAEGNTAGGVIASCWWTSRGLRTCACVRSPHAREPGEPIVTLGVLVDDAPSRCVDRGVADRWVLGRAGKAEVVIP
jgi:hypothetical protein